MKCPHCKREIIMTPIESLKNHITLRLKNQQSWVDRRVKGKRLPSRTMLNTLSKWQGWLKAIEDLEAKGLDNGKADS